MLDDDFRFKKSDKYQPEGLNQTRFDELKPLILSAIEKRHCTLLQIKRACQVPMSEDISRILEVMEEAKLIVRLYNGIHTAFFLNQAEKIPTKFWLGGNDKVEVSFEKIEKPVGQPTSQPIQPKPQPPEGLYGDGFFNHLRFKPEGWDEETVKKMASLGLSLVDTAHKFNIPVSVFKQNLKIETFKKIWDETRRNIQKPVEEKKPEPVAIVERVIQPEKLEIKSETKNFKPKWKLGFSPKTLEITAERQADLRAVAKYLNVTVRELNNLKRNNPEFDEAYNRGRLNRKNQTEQSEIKRPQEEIVETQPVTVDRKPKGINYTPGLFEDFGKRNLTYIQMGKELGVSEGTITYHFRQNPKFKEAYQNGRKIYTESNSVKNSKKKPNVKYTQEMFETFGFRKLNQRQIADELGVSQATLSHHLKKPEFRTAYQRGVDKEIVEVAEKVDTNGIILNQLPIEDPNVVEEKPSSFMADMMEGSIASPIQPIAVSSNRHSELLERLDAKNSDMKIIGSPNFGYTELNFAPMPQLLPQKAVDLGNGGICSITLVNYNPFAATEKSREFVERLVRLANEFSE